MYNNIYACIRIYIYIGENEKDKEATRQEIMQFMVSILCIVSFILYIRNPPELLLHFA